MLALRAKTGVAPERGREPDGAHGRGGPHERDQPGVGPAGDDGAPKVPEVQVSRADRSPELELRMVIWTGSAYTHAHTVSWAAVCPDVARASFDSHSVGGDDPLNPRRWRHASQPVGGRETSSPAR